MIPTAYLKAARTVFRGEHVLMQWWSSDQVVQIDESGHPIFVNGEWRTIPKEDPPDIEKK